ncbi:MAG TPA: glycine dehydrogenase, partial [Spirochaetia bacterium]
SLNALAAAVYMTSLGPRGLARAAELSWHKAHYAASRIATLPGYRVEPGEFFHEFSVVCPRPVGETNKRLFDRNGIIGGYDLGIDYPERAGQMLVCCTEMSTKTEIDRLVAALGEVGNA